MDFKIYRADSAEQIKFGVMLGEPLEWITNADYDHHRYYSFDPQGSYIGKLGDQKISFVVMAMYGDKEFCHIGHFIVNPNFRGQGYGKKTWDYAWSQIPQNCSVSLSSALDMTSKYQALYGFQPAWRDVFFSCKAESLLTLKPPPQQVMKPLRDCSFSKLISYDKSVFGFTRESALETMLSIPACEGWALYNDKQEIQGYCNIWQGDATSEGTWSVSPLYADDISIATLLLQKIASFVLGKDKDTKLILTVPEVNKKGYELIRSVSTEVLGETVRMFARGIPRSIQDNCVTQQRVFSYCSLVTGP